MFNLRFWLIRRWLRQMGFREIADHASAETLLLLEKENSQEFNRIFRWFNIGLFAVVILNMWLIVWLRAMEPMPTAVPPPEKAHSSPALPATTDLELPDFEEPAPLSYAS